jgi:hypothetical protein
MTLGLVLPLAIRKLPYRHSSFEDETSVKFRPPWVDDCQIASTLPPLPELEQWEIEDSLTRKPDPAKQIAPPAPLVPLVVAHSENVHPIIDTVNPVLFRYTAPPFVVDVHPA